MPKDVFQASAAEVSDNHDNRSNWGRGRYVPFNPDNKIIVHDSVRRRIELTKDLPYPYTPRAEDWADILELVTWVDESANDMIVSTSV